MDMLRHGSILLAAWLALGAGCTAPFGPQALERANLVIVDPAAIPEDELLDIDIRPFTPVPESVNARTRALEFGDGLFGVEVPNVRTLRQAEGHYLSRELANKLEGSGHWGLVRLNPYGMSGADLEVTGTIVKSDGISLRIRVEARDSRGKLWLSRLYTQLTPTVAVDGDVSGPAFPFPDVFNAIANDLVNTRARMLDSDEIEELRQHSTLKFAAELAPSVYETYRQKDTVVRLPAQDDPVFEVVQEMRARNDTFLDAMQLSYDLYVDQIARNYLRFLYQSQQVTAQLQDYDRPGSPAQQNAGVGRRARLRNPEEVYDRAIADLSQPLEEAVAPLTLEFNGHTAELSGTLENQFRQWQVILLDMYHTETGTPVP
jgi:hypothetical protein